MGEESEHRTSNALERCRTGSEAEVFAGIDGLSEQFDESVRCHARAAEQGAEGAFGELLVIGNREADHDGIMRRQSQRDGFPR